MEVFTAMLLPLLALDLHLGIMADSIHAIHALLTDKFLSRHFGIINFLESIDRRLAATFSGNLPVTDSDFMVAQLVFVDADIMKGQYISSQRADSLKQSGPFLIDGYSVALAVALPNLTASSRRAQFDGLDVAIECFKFVFGKSIGTFHQATTDIHQSVRIILQSSRFELTIVLPIRWWGFSAKRARMLAVLLLDQSLICLDTPDANQVPTAGLIN